MMTGVILAAGQGARLNAGQGNRPKCLVPIGGDTLLGRNIRLLRHAGIDDIVVVIGCEAETVRRSAPDVTFVENPVYARTNSLYSLWLARTHLAAGFVVMNCDVLVHPQLLADLLDAHYEDALLVDYLADGPPYGDEEMKVQVRRGCVADISKGLAPGETDGENVGVAKFGAAGAAALITEMDAVVGANDLKAWVPRAFKGFAAHRPLHAIGTRGLPWIEIDFPEDYRRALDVVLPLIEDTARDEATVAGTRVARTA